MRLYFKETLYRFGKVKRPPLIIQHPGSTKDQRLIGGTVATFGLLREIEDVLTEQRGLEKARFCLIVFPAR